MIAPYTVQYTFMQGQRMIQAELIVFASSERYAVQKVENEIARRFGSSKALHIYPVRHISPLSTQQTVPYT